MGRNVVVTGVGIVTSLGEDADVHVARLGSAEPPVTAIEPVSGRIVHPICAIDVGLQIPKRSHQRLWGFRHVQKEGRRGSGRNRRWDQDEALQLRYHCCHIMCVVELRAFVP